MPEGNGKVQPQVTVGLLWHSATSDNLGVGALSLSQMAIVEEIGAALGISVRFVIYGWRDPRTAYHQRPGTRIFEILARDLIPFGRLWRDMRGCDLVLDIGGGDSFSDIYGIGRAIKMNLGALNVDLARKPRVISPQTIGPFRTGLIRFIAFFMMRRARAVFARDAMSIDEMRRAGYRGQIGQASDVALRLPYFSRSQSEDRPQGPVRVGVNVSGLLVNGGYTGKNMFNLSVDYRRMMLRILARFAGLAEVELHLVPHVVSEATAIEDDVRANEAMAQQLRDDFGRQVICAPPFASPSEAKSYISGMDFFVGARMHACIAALSSGVPVVPLAYSRKFSGLFGAIGYPHTVDCTELDEAAIESAVFEGFANRLVLRREAEAALAIGLERLREYEGALGRILTTISESP